MRTRLAGFFNCICDMSECPEKACVKWDRARSSDMIHIRIDGCVVTSNDVQKCDCLVLYTPSGADKCFVFLVEAKSTSYGVDEVVNQLQTGRDVFNRVVQSIGAATIQPAFVQSLLPVELQGNAGLVSLLVRSLSCLRTQQYAIIPVLCANKKIDLLKRVGYSDRFKITVGKRKLPIHFKKCGEDILDVVKRPA